jgi:type I restriction-modification system DNA methylase subunit
MFGSIEDARKAIGDLVERFAANRDHYRAPSYNEETARSEFITPFFEALGWDVHNRSGAAERYKDCVHEESIKVGDYTKAPDYSFRIGGNKVFFVEAKKPSVDLATDPLPAFQLRRYAYSTKLSLSVLTDFEELAVYDTRLTPRPSDKAGVGRVLFWKCEEYLDKLDEIWGLLSKEAVLTGAFDRYAASTKKRGTMPVDAEFLKDIEEWRDELARNIALRNGELTVEDLNFAVQTTIDRIIFLRVAEGQGAEEYGTLQALSNGNNVHARLVALYHRADQRYNSGLFDFERDPITPSLQIDDKVIKGIVGKLYERSPYDFSAIPVEILGNVYEQFLGRVIHLTKSHQARVEEKPEVKKAGGVFYTPSFVVKHIVDRTLGPLCKGKTPKQMKGLRVLDPACGSGSFLLQAYQLLLDEHLAWYEAHDPASHKKEVYLGPGKKWRLTSAEKHAILLSSIFGVDIDTQAVEVSKLSLLLKVLEGETAQTLRQFGLFGERALPSLERNIRCGNSLIEHADVKGLFTDDEEKKRINAFDWKKEFPKVFAEGGFDVVIGNPPYIRVQAMQEWAPREVELYKELYRSAASGNYDIYVVFVEKALKLLNAEGRLGFIIPQKFWQVQFGEPLRALLTEARHVAHVTNFRNNQAFASAFVNTAIHVFTKQPNTRFSYIEIPPLEKGGSLAAALATASESRIPASVLGRGPWILKPAPVLELLRKLTKGHQTLETVTDRIFQGLKTSADRVYVLDLVHAGKSVIRARSPELDEEVQLEADLCHPLIKGTEMRPYTPLPHKRVVLFPYGLNDDGRVALIGEKKLKSEFPLAWKYLLANRTTLEKREDGRMRGDKWYAYIYPKALDVMSMPKLITPDLAPRSSFLLDDRGAYFILGGAAGGYGLLPKDGVDRLCLLGLLNSRLLSFVMTAGGQQMESGYYSFEARFIRGAPIELPTGPAAKSFRALVERMLDLKRQLLAAKSPHEKTRLERQVGSTDEEIDDLVYGLYGLSSGEIELVKKETKPRTAVIDPG